MNSDKIEKLASDILTAMYANPNTYQNDYRHNALVALNAARALSMVISDSEHARHSKGNNEDATTTRA